MTKLSNDPLHGVTLKMMLETLHKELGWEGLAARININCFKSNPSFKSSLTFLRRTPWARDKVEMLYNKSQGIRPMKHVLDTEPPPSNIIQGDNPWLKNKR